jgi:hypothetical protein
MNAFQVIVLVMLVWLAFLLAARRELHRMQAHCLALRRAAVTEPERLEERSEPIGSYEGLEIYASVKFMGQRYRFAGVAPQAYRERVESRELFVEPGLVYRVDG